MPPDVYLDVTIGTAAPARITISLFTTETPTTCSNFRLLCTNRAPLPTYLSTPIHRIIPTFMLQGGDTTAGNGTGGQSAIQPNGGAIPDENLHWRAIDEPGLVCMANRGKDTGTSQFFITCDAAEWLSGKHTVFGKVVGGMEVVREVERVGTAEGDVPVMPVVVTGCGEVTGGEGHANRERKRHGGRRRESKKGREGVDGALDGAADEPERERSERRHHRRHRSRSRSPRRGASPRGERRHRDRSRDRDHRRHDRRERGHRREDVDYVRDDQDAEERIRREEQEREAARRYDDDDAKVGEKKGKVTFKGRGSMKYRENKGWGAGGGGRLD